ncbi:MAG: hypothetical protein A2566_02170 [Candidatus Zambryskibacteria bacterium RIFOXYD1_FULL_40_13]|nr:MAG: Methionine biosynthesis protein MetW [Parcubacteria group bacterium GW2011_GWC1_39_12]KKR35585.1 MAG: Methionine biosynthesis protein MetW [Parcubacteria group bacterium GW2011_GWC2_40_10]KKR51996.1 MAG: Methionine biosynthesis protein MetW [Parcubacteria group bacterium GW2011_GWE1_40_20]KKR66345.1 MAG: Methionine biosynthesis protein MetW [Parcubacteria group bacterium GW2011_GWB1_40_5]KKR68498.1 MAG: Methionine biosynthesis protein MetW [Parcubacteria group bacterium GW2011_GWF2_40_6
MNIYNNIKLANFNYDSYWQGRDFKIRNKLFEREVIFSDWIKDRSKVLDVAVGNSYLPVYLKEKKGCEVVVYDLVPKVIDEYKKHGITAEAKSIYDTAKETNIKYDYIVMSEILEHLPTPEDTIVQISKLTDYLVISIPNSAFYRFRLQLLFGRFFKQWVHHPSEHLRFWSHTDFLDWFSSLDLEVLKTEASNGLDIGPLKLFKYFPNLFGHQMCYLVKRK